MIDEAKLRRFLTDQIVALNSDIGDIESQPCRSGYSLTERIRRDAYKNILNRINAGEFRAVCTPDIADLCEED